MPLTTTFEYETISTTTSYGEYGQESSITERRRVTRRDGAVFGGWADVNTAQNEGALPRRGDLAFSVGTGLTWEQYCRCRGFDWENLPNAAGAIFTIRYSTRYALTLHGAGPTPFYTPAVRTEFQTVTRSLRIYRTGWTTNPPAASDASSDIGGTAVQGVGDSMAWPINQTRIRMRFEQDATATTPLTAAATLGTYNNTRNSNTFFNCSAGTLVCEGITVNPTQDEFYEVVFDFLYDPLYHHEQVPDLAPDGRPDRVATGPKTVKWKRIPRTSTDFNNIYGGSASLRSLAERGYAYP